VWLNNPQAVRRFYADLIAHGRFDAAPDLLAPDYVDHEVSPERPGSHGFLTWLEAFDRAFRNRVIVLDDVTAEGDVASVRWSLAATHSRAFLGYPPTGQTLEVTAVGVFRFEDGKIAERWEHEEGPGLMRQLALLGAEADHRLDLRALAQHGLATQAAVNRRSAEVGLLASAGGRTLSLR
jgi:steroid delta-isomerase-like uncharacterized protein